MTLSTAITFTTDNALQASPLVIDDARVALDALREHALFDQLRNDDFDSLAARARLVHLNRHELVYRQDSDARHFYFMVSGKLRLYRLDCSGLERTLDSIGAGDCFAELMVYADPPRYACYAEALTSSQILMIPIKAFQDMLESNPVYAQAALRHYAKRAVSRFHDLEIMTVQNARDRLVRYLIDLLPNGTEKGTEIELPLPKCLVASRLAMQPETFSRILADLKSSGLVRVKRSRLVISDPQRLIQMSQ